MSIVTQCPSCGTKFRVTPPQLQAQHGMVRCGRCAQVFDGFKTLATLPDTPEPPVTPPPAGPAPALPAEGRQTKDAGAAPLAAAPASAAIDKPPDAPAPAQAASEKSAGAAAPAQAAPTGAVEPKREPVYIFEPEPAPSALFDFDPPKRPKRGWAVGAALLLCTLAAQGAYYYRSDIAATLPEARPHLNKMCELLHCTVPLPQNPRQISIEASDMQAVDPANPGLIALTATLRSHASTALGYPALDVVLTNTKEHTVARRIFMPADYLPAGKDSRTGIAANAEVTIRLDLETGDLGAAGFRLDLIAAPAR